MKKIVLSSSVVLTCLIACYGYLHFFNQKVAVVDLVKLFNDFELKQHLEKADSIKLLHTMHSIDSVKETFSNNRYTDHELNSIYHDLDQQYYKVYNESNERINKVVWEKLNVLIKQYGADKNIDILVGANGLGSVVYYKNSYDVTEQLIKYANENYSK